MTEDEFYEQAHEEWDPAEGSNMLAEAKTWEDEHRVMPSESVLLTRTHATYTECLTVSGYPGLRMIIVTMPEVSASDMTGTMPGVIRELPVSWRDMATEDTFRERLMSVVGTYESCGWRR
jgi:hypothetical protein